MADMFNGFLAAMREDQVARGLDVDQMTQAELASHMRSMGLALMLEAAELVETFEWKPWKRSWNEGIPGDSEETLDEACDLLHFLAHLLSVADIDDDDLNRGMARCREKNRARVEGGYGYRQG